MTGKTLKEWMESGEVTVGDTLIWDGENDILEDWNVINYGAFAGEVEASFKEYGSGIFGPGELFSRATSPLPDLSTLSRDQLEELGQRVAVELEKKPEVAVMHGRRCGDAYWSFIPAPKENNTHKLTIPDNLPPGTYISSDGNEIKVEEV